MHTFDDCRCRLELDLKKEKGTEHPGFLHVYTFGGGVIRQLIERNGAKSFYEQIMGFKSLTDGDLKLAAVIKNLFGTHFVVYLVNIDSTLSLYSDSDPIKDNVSIEDCFHTDDNSEIAGLLYVGGDLIVANEYVQVMVNK